MTHVEDIIIVSGLPRSGTSMMMQVLEAGGVPAVKDDLRLPDQDNPKGYYEFEPVKQLGSDHSFLDRARGHAVKVIHMLLTELPDGFQYRVIFMHRAIGEVISSQRAMLARQGKSGARIGDDKLAEVLEKQRTRTRAWLDTRENFRVLDVQYQSVFEQPGDFASEINRFLGGGLNEAAMRAAIDPALYRQRQSQQE